jgi:hypothetical protein
MVVTLIDSKEHCWMGTACDKPVEVQLISWAGYLRIYPSSKLLSPIKKHICSLEVNFDFTFEKGGIFFLELTVFACCTFLHEDGTNFD